VQNELNLLYVDTGTLVNETIFKYGQTRTGGPEKRKVTRMHLRRWAAGETLPQ